jgi:hypothetical protein
MVAPRRFSPKLLLAVGLPAALLLGIACWKPWLPERDEDPVVGAQTADRDERLRRQVVGTWEDDYQGKRTMTLQEDRTGTMVVELGGWKATLFAARLRFDMAWSVEGGRLQKRTTGGEPADKVAMILKTMGDRAEESILELDDDRLLLLDGDGKTTYHWRRVR